MALPDTIIFAPAWKTLNTRSVTWDTSKGSDRREAEGQRSTARRHRHRHRASRRCSCTSPTATSSSPLLLPERTRNTSFRLGRLQEPRLKQGELRPHTTLTSPASPFPPTTKHRKAAPPAAISRGGDAPRAARAQPLTSAHLWMVSGPTPPSTSMSSDGNCVLSHCT